MKRVIYSVHAMLLAINVFIYHSALWPSVCSSYG